MATQKKYAHPQTDQDGGEQFLDNIEEFTLTLEDGTVLRVDIQRELQTPDDPIHVRYALMRAPARFAFWAYQYERAQALAKKAEQELVQEEAIVWHVYKQQFDAALGRNYYHNIIQRRVDADEGVLDKRRHLVETQKHAGLLRALRDAVQHRIFVLRTLAAPAGRYET